MSLKDYFDDDYDHDLKTFKNNTEKRSIEKFRKICTSEGLKKMTNFEKDGKSNPGNPQLTKLKHVALHRTA